MITRIVKMIFREKEIAAFIEIFNSSCSKIRSFEGCNALNLLQSLEDKRIFFTISKWNSANDLEKYRSSELFQSTWEKTKILFEEKPEAWTTVNAL